MRTQRPPHWSLSHSRRELPVEWGAQLRQTRHLGLPSQAPTSFLELLPSRRQSLGDSVACSQGEQLEQSWALFGSVAKFFGFMSLVTGDFWASGIFSFTKSRPWWLSC